MTQLYNCRHAGDQYRMTKFNEHLDVESSYLCTTKECDCPAGQRPMCRHREMLPKFLQRGTVGTDWFYDYSRGGWVQMDYEPEEMPPLPAGVQLVSLDNPEAVYNAIADAVGEPRASVPAKRSWRRF